MLEAVRSYIFYVQFVKGPRREGKREKRVERREKITKSGKKMRENEGEAVK